MAAGPQTTHRRRLTATTRAQTFPTSPARSSAAAMSGFDRPALDLALRCTLPGTLPVAVAMSGFLRSSAQRLLCSETRAASVRKLRRNSARPAAQVIGVQGIFSAPGAWPAFGNCLALIALLPLRTLPACSSRARSSRPWVNLVGPHAESVPIRRSPSRGQWRHGSLLVVGAGLALPEGTASGRHAHHGRQARVPAEAIDLVVRQPAAEVLTGPARARLVLVGKVHVRIAPAPARRSL